MPSSWDFCHFLHEYDKPEHNKQLYLVTAITSPFNSLRGRLALTEALRGCPDLYRSLYDARLWMSQGNTTSSLHFDTHDNLLLQVDGDKEVLLWHPNESAKLYMDFHDKFGLSPINVDRVDLERFPEVANAATIVANLSAGDAVYIPDGWWHVVRSHKRNIAVALEFAPFAGEQGLWPRRIQQRRQAPGIFWAEQQRISATMHEMLLREGESSYLAEAGLVRASPSPLPHPSPQL